MGAEEEVLSLRKGKFPLRRLSEGIDDVERGSEGGRTWDDQKGWGASLKEREDEYLEIKSAGFSTRKKVRYMDDCLAGAEEMTLRALREAGSAAEGVVPRISTGKAANLDLFGLVGPGSEKGLRAFENILQAGVEEGSGRTRVD